MGVPPAIPARPCKCSHDCRDLRATACRRRCQSFRLYERISAARAVAGSSRRHVECTAYRRWMKRRWPDRRPWLGCEILEQRLSQRGDSGLGAGKRKLEVMADAARPRAGSSSTASMSIPRNSIPAPARLTFNPDAHWSLQVSGGFLKSPEQLAPGDGNRRHRPAPPITTPLNSAASQPPSHSGRQRHLTGAHFEDAGLAEAEFKPEDFLFARAESPAPAATNWSPVPPCAARARFRWAAIHDWALAEHYKLGLGGLYAFDFAPTSATAPYGGGPHGAMAFVRS